MSLSPQEIVQREVLACVSSLVATLAEGTNYMIERRGEPATELAYQAQELCFPVDDWEEAAIQAGWTDEDGTWSRPARDDEDTVERTLRRDTAQEACEADDLEPYQREVFEHWIVSDWLADKLEAEGEKVDKDFAGLCVWARTTTGQAIYADGVMERIAAKLAEG